MLLLDCVAFSGLRYLEGIIPQGVALAFNIHAPSRF